MFNISEKKLLNLIQSFEELIDRDKSYELKKKREEWDKLEKALSDPFNEIDSNNSGTIEKSELEKYIDQDYLNELIIRYGNKYGEIDINNFNKIIERLYSEGDEWAFSYKKSQDWYKFIIKQKIHTTYLNKRKSIEKPTLIISYGPSGSGKSTNINKFILENGYNPVIINIDDLTKQYMNTILNNTEMFSDQERYFNVRSKWPMLARDELIKESFMQKKDFVIETTGRGTTAADTIIPEAINNDYNIIIIYILVPYIDLIIRLIKRQQKTGQGHPAFNNLLSMCIKASENINYYKKKIGQNGKILFIDNSEKEGKLYENIKDLNLAKFMKKIQQNLKNL